MSEQLEQIDILEQSDVSLLETLDHVLNRGLVIAGEITISVADIDLIFVGLNVLVSSVETANEVLRKRECSYMSTASPRSRPCRSPRWQRQSSAFRVRMSRSSR